MWFEVMAVGGRVSWDGGPLWELLQPFGEGEEGWTGVEVSHLSRGHYGS